MTNLIQKYSEYGKIYLMMFSNIISKQLISVNYFVAESDNTNSNNNRKRLNFSYKLQKISSSRSKEIEKNSDSFYNTHMNSKFQRGKKKQLQEKDNDKKYADLELCYQQYNSKRRLYDLQRMFKRKNYKASLAQDPFRRYKTETYQHNAGSPMSFYNSKTPKQNQYHGRLSNQINSPNTPNVYKNHMYHDSLDNLNIKQDIGLHKTPQNLNPQQYNTYNNAIHERK